MGTFCYYHVPGENGERLRLENAEALQVCRQAEPGKNIAYYYPDAAESYACYLRECGDEHSAPGKDTGNRINLKTTYFHYVYGGSGSFNRQPVRAGDCCIAWAGKAHRLCSDPQDPLKFYFVGVGGYDHMRFLKTLGFRETPEIFSCSCEEVRETLIEPVLYNTPQGVNPAGYALGKMILLFSRQCPVAAVEKVRYVEELTLAKQMMAESRYTVPVAELADRLGISRKHFSVLFHRATGTSVRTYMLEHRMHLAKSYLANGCPVSEVAELLGYNDYAAFYNAFLRTEGVSPSRYAAFIRGETETK